jgi:hypothetical protein
MNNKQLAEMIKTLRKKKLEEQNPKAETSDYLKKQKFKPEHNPDSSEASPNDYRHRMAEASSFSQLDETLGGTYHKRQMNIFKARLKPSQRTWTKEGQQGMRGGKRYTAEENKKEVELGPTDTGQTGETVTSNPTDDTPSAKGSMNKNTTNKELKEKKNATMG